MPCSRPGMSFVPRAGALDLRVTADAFAHRPPAASSGNKANKVSLVGRRVAVHCLPALDLRLCVPHQETNDRRQSVIAILLRQMSGSDFLP